MDKILTEAYSRLTAIEEATPSNEFDSAWAELDDRLKSAMRSLVSLRRNPTMGALTSLDMDLEELPRLGEELGAAITSGMSDEEQDNFYNEGNEFNG